MQRRRRFFRNRSGGLAPIILGLALITGAHGAFGSSSEPHVTWTALLEPYSRGDKLPYEYSIRTVARGVADDIVVTLDGPDQSRVEVHFLQRGRWRDVRESSSFSIAYEISQTTAPRVEAEAVTEALASLVRSRDSGLPLPNAIPLGEAFESIWPWWVLKSDLTAGLLQIAWAVLLLGSPFLLAQVARVLAISTTRLFLAALLSAVVASAAIWTQPDEPLHANGHAWREAREVMAPWHGGADTAGPFLHGRGGIALQWLVAGTELAFSGNADPLRISRISHPLAAAAACILAIVLTGAPAAGLFAGIVVALLPLARMLALSGSNLAIAAWILPWSLALFLTGVREWDTRLMAGAATATALGTLSHTAMLSWVPALGAASFFMQKGTSPRLGVLVPAMSAVLAAWYMQADNTLSMVLDRSSATGSGLLEAARGGLLSHNLFFDPHWVSPFLPPLLLLAVLAGLWREQRSLRAAVCALAVASPPFFAVTTCSSDAIRYQAPLLGLISGIVTAGLWNISRFAAVRTAIVCRIAILAGLVAIPLPTRQQPLDPVAVEHGLVTRAFAHMPAHSLIVLPRGRFPHVIPEFPDFLLPQGISTAAAGDPFIERFEGPVFVYLGLACISFDGPGDTPPAQMRPECQPLRENTTPWAVSSLRADELPYGSDGKPWTFHRLAEEVPFGFFAQNAAARAIPVWSEKQPH